MIVIIIFARALFLDNYPSTWRLLARVSGLVARLLPTTLPNLNPSMMFLSLS
jgi:hypothetical protein